MRPGLRFRLICIALLAARPIITITGQPRTPESEARRPGPFPPREYPHTERPE